MASAGPRGASLSAAVTLRAMTRLGALALVALAVALPACGDDENDDAGGGAQPTSVDELQTAPEEGGTTSTTEGEGEDEDEDQESTSGGEEQDPTSEAPSRAEYIRSADRICRTAQLAIARQSAEYRSVTKAFAQGKVEREEYYRRAGGLTVESGEIAMGAVADLKELPQPSSAREAIEAYLRGATTQSELLTAQGRALQQGNAKEVAKLDPRVGRANGKTRTAARRVGFRVCGGGGS